MTNNFVSQCGIILNEIIKNAFEEGVSHAFYVKVLFGRGSSRCGYPPSHRPMICGPEIPVTPLGSRQKYIFSKKIKRKKNRRIIVAKSASLGKSNLLTV